MANLEEIKAMVTGGMTAQAIAEELNLSVQYTYKLITALGLSGQTKRKSVLDSLTEEEVESIIEQYTNDVPVAKIIFQYGLNYNAFYNLLTRKGVSYRERTAEAREVRKERLNLAVLLYEKGLPLTQIELETGIRQPELHRQLHARGVPLRRGSTLIARLGITQEELDEIEISSLTDRERELLKPEDDPDTELTHAKQLEMFEHQSFEQYDLGQQIEKLLRDKTGR